MRSWSYALPFSWRCQMDSYKALDWWMYIKWQKTQDNAKKSRYGPFAIEKGVTAGKIFFWVNTISGHISAQKSYLAYKCKIGFSRQFPPFLLQKAHIYKFCVRLSMKSNLLISRGAHLHYISYRSYFFIFFIRLTSIQ